MLLTVNTTQELVATLKGASAGDTIQLASGVYTPINLRDFNFASDVTITSQNPEAEAVLTGLMVRNSHGLRFENLEFAVSSTPGQQIPFQVIGSSEIHLDSINVHGSLDGSPQDDQGGVQIRESENVSVTNSEFQQLSHALTHLDNTGITFSGNYFHDLRIDGIRGGGSSDVTITDNFFTNFSPIAGDHPDAIQFWTGRTTEAAQNIVIANNIVSRGSGAPTQGIFMSDEIGDLPFTNVQITGNLVVGGLGRGISVAGGQDIAIGSNTVSGLADQETWIIVQSASDVVLTDNVATRYVFSETTNLLESNDVVLAAVTDGGRALMEQWIATHTQAPSLLHRDVASVAQNSSAAAPGFAWTFGQTVTSSDLIVQTMEATRLRTVTMTGTGGADRLTVDGIHDTRVNAGAGNDVLTGGGAGHNDLNGGAGDDTYYVRSLNDTVIEAANGGNDNVSASVDITLSDYIEVLKLTGSATYGAGNAQANKITGGEGDDTLLGMAGDDSLYGLEGDDSLGGGDGADTMSGRVGDDTLHGDAGVDKLDGNEGADVLFGGAGADTISGGAGSDSVSGGAGADTFMFRPGDLTSGAEPRDVIFDFSRAEGDRINLVAFDAKDATTANEAFSFVGLKAFSKFAGELRYEVSNGVAQIQGDTDGDGLANFQIDVVGTTIFRADDFLL